MNKILKIALPLIGVALVSLLLLQWYSNVVLKLIFAFSTVLGSGLGTIGVIDEFMHRGEIQ